MHAHAFESYNNNKLVNFYITTSIRHHIIKIRKYIYVHCLLQADSLESHHIFFIILANVLSWQHCMGSVLKKQTHEIKQ